MKCEEYLFTCDNQFGFKAQHSTEFCIYSLLEFIDYYKKRNTTVFVTFLDASKAFDRVNYWMLFSKLIDKNVPLFIVKLLVFWYTKQEMKVRWGNTISSSFKVGNGVKQGGILSPVLFNIYIDKLSIALNDTAIGGKIGGQLLNHLCYSDDMCLISISSSGMQQLLNVYHSFSIEHSLLYNETKSYSLCFKHNSIKFERSGFYLGEMLIPKVTQYKYLGVIISDHNCDLDLKRQMRKFYTNANMLIRKFFKCTVDVKCYLFKTYCSTTSGILTHQISDHFMSFSIVEGNIKNIKEPVKYIEVQNINSASIINFKNSVGNSNLFSQFDLSLDANPNDNYNIRSSILEQAKNKHIPKRIQRLNRRKHFIEPWMNRELLTLINKKNDKYRDWKSTNNDVEYEVKKINFKTFERIVKENIRAAKREYYFKTFTAQKMDMKKTWKTIDETLNRRKNKSKFPSEFIVNNRSITDHKEFADQFNIFLSNIGSTLSDSIEINDNTLDFTDYLNNPTELRFNFNRITESETLSIINKLKSKNSSGKDEISNKLLKSIKDEIAKPLTIIINQSLKTGIFPEALKIAKVKPLYKKGDNFCLNNYRPISLLPTISKIFERVMFTQLYSYLNAHNLLSEQQYGFRSQHSTELACVKLVDYITTEMDNIKKK